MIPDWWHGLILALAVFRVCRLLGWDDLPPVVRLRNWVVGASLRQTGSANSLAGVTGETPTSQWVIRRPLLHHFLGCAYCLGFWVSAAAYVGWVFAPRQLFYVAFPFALSGAVGIVARRLDP